MPYTKQVLRQSLKPQTAQKCLCSLVNGQEGMFAILLRPWRRKAIVLQIDDSGCVLQTSGVAVRLLTGEGAVLHAAHNASVEAVVETTNCTEMP